MVGGGGGGGGGEKKKFCEELPFYMPSKDQLKQDYSLFAIKISGIQFLTCYTRIEIRFSN